MKRNSLPRAFVLGTVSLAAALALSACGASNEDDPADSTAGGSDGGSDAFSGQLNGAGSTAQEAAMGVWRANFQTSNPKVTVNYDAQGSGAGREQFLAGGVEFAGSDAYLSDDELASAKDTCGGNALEFPVYVSPIAVIYNLPGVDKLNLGPATVAKIFAGTITKWDDEAIKADNPDADLPDTDISPVHRSDESGTTENFTDYLGQVASTDWTYGPIQTWPIKSGEGADGTSGVVAAVTNGEGTIGYADASQAKVLGIASIGVGSEFVDPTADAASAVLDESTPVDGRETGDIALEVNRTTEKSGVYPIVLVSYHIVCSTYKDQATADLVKGFESYVISAEGQDASAATAGNAPITDAIREKAQAAIDTITAK